MNESTMDYTEESCALQTDKKILSLILTEECNLRCTYCYQNERRSNKKNIMPFNVATNAIQNHLTRNDEFKKVIIQLIGGEVLLYWDYVCKLIKWVTDRRQMWKKEVVFFIDTNGTLMDNAKKAWFYKQRKKVILGLSFDGTPEAQNLNRSNSYDRIKPHLSYFAQTWPNQPVKMTISPKTISMVFDGIIHIMQHGFLVAANLPLEKIWGSFEEKAIHIESFKQEIKKLVDFFGKNQKIPLPSIIDLPISTITSEKDRNRPWCGSGRNMIAIERNGKEIPCSRYASMSFDQSLFKQELSPINSHCYQCMFKPACQTCEVHNWEVNGNPKSRTSFHCEFVKLQIWGTAQVHAARINKRLKEIESMSSEEKLAHKEEFALIHNQLLTIALIIDHFEKNDNF